MTVIFVILSKKTHAFEELKAMIKKCPISLFFDDGKFMDMKATPIDTGLVSDKEYGVFVRNQKNTYLGKRTKAVYDVYDTSFAPGISVSAAVAASELKKYVTDELDFEAVGKRIADGSLDGDTTVNCIRSNVNMSHVKELFNYISPHNIQSSVEKKITQKIRSMNQSNNNQLILTFVAVFGAIIGGYILLKLFNQ